MAGSGSKQLTCSARYGDDFTKGQRQEDRGPARGLKDELRRTGAEKRPDAAFQPHAGPSPPTPTPNSAPRDCLAQGHLFMQGVNSSQSAALAAGAAAQSDLTTGPINLLRTRGLCSVFLLQL